MRFKDPIQTWETYVILLSRHNLNETKEELIPAVDFSYITVNQHLLMSADRYKEFQQETLKDASLQQLLNNVLIG